MTGANVHSNLRRLLQEGTIRKTKRDGKSAYELRSQSSKS
jgi:ribosomal protein L19E